MTEHPKVDLKKTLNSYRARHGRFDLIEVPERVYLMVDGHGDPNTSPAYTAALEALYPVAYALKSASRKELRRDYVVPPLEGLWWAQDMDAFTADRDKSRWDWTMMILVPDWIEASMVEAAIGARDGIVRRQSFAEGTCLQTLHVGSFDDEAPVLARMHDEEIPSRGLRMTGTHHEIYLSDARRVAPARMRTILRQPVAPIVG